MTRFSTLLAATSLALAGGAFADQLIETPSFEWPPIKKRLTRAEGGDLKKSPMNAGWTMFRDKTTAEGGKLVFGLTNELSRSGRQCMFVEFEKLTQKGAVATLSTDLIPIRPSKTYRFGIWGRVDKKNPIAHDSRIPYLKLRVDWFKDSIDEDTEEPSFEQAGDAYNRVQPIPGAPNRRPFFTPNQWSEFAIELTSPEDAGYVKVTWTWESTPQDGETNGVAYFDDATVSGEPGPKVDPFADDPEIMAERKATENDPDLVKPDDDKPTLDATPLTTPPVPLKPKAPATPPKK